MIGAGRDKRPLMKSAGLVLGILIGGPLGPAVFTPLGLDIATAATAGALVGAVVGYGAVSAAILIAARRRDRELQAAAEAVRAEAGLPASIRIKVKDAQITVAGEVEDFAVRRKAEEVFSTLPGITAVTNLLRLRRAAAPLGATADDIKRRIEDSLVRLAKSDAQRIRVLVNNSRAILEGTVQSRAEASEAESIAWQTPGIIEVENRLKPAA